MKIGSKNTVQALMPEQVINLERYPIEDTDSLLFKELTQRLREQLEQQQYVVLPDFIQPAARNQAIEQVEGV